MFSLNDVMGKWLLGTYTVGQLLLIRSVAALAVLTPAMLREGAANLAHPPRPGLQVLRVVLTTLEVAFFYWAVSYMPLAETVTYYLAGPIYVALMARPLLGETIPLRRWAAIGLGFVGVVLALDPGGAAFGWPAIIAFIGSVSFALSMIITRMVRGTSDTVLVAWQTVAALIAGAMLAPFGWTMPSARDFVLLGLLGIVAMGAHMATNRSLKLAPANVVVPYQYTLIVWAVLLGWLVFGDLPALTTLAGAAIIIFAGVWIFLDERRAR